MPFLALIFFVFLAIKRTDGFRDDLITKYDKTEKKWEINQEDAIKEAQSILSQDFHYLTRGRECFIFERIFFRYRISNDWRNIQSTPTLSRIL